MPKRKGTTEMIVGLFVLASLAVLLAFVILIGSRQRVFESRYEMIGVFDAVAGLQPGAEVHLAGINVGHVMEIQFGRTNKVEAVMSVSTTQMERIREDSIATIRTMGLMGDRYIDITVGSQDQPMIPEGGTIRTAELFEIGEMLEEARPMLENLENAIRNVSLLTDELADPTGEVGTILENVKVLTTDTREGRGTLGALLRKDDIYLKTNEILDTTSATMDNLEVFSENARGASDRLPEIMNEAQASVSEFRQFSQNASQAAAGFVEIVDDGREVVKDARIMAVNLREASGEIREAAPRLGLLISSADEGVTEAKKVVDAAKRNWLIRGYFEPTVPGEPISLSGRDMAQPEVTK